MQDESLVGRGCLGPFHLFIDKLNFSSKALNGNYYNMAVTHDQLLIFFFPLRPGNKMLNVPLLTLKTPSRHLHSRRAVYIFFFFFLNLQVTTLVLRPLVKGMYVIARDYCLGG